MIFYAVPPDGTIYTLHRRLGISAMTLGLTQVRAALCCARCARWAAPTQHGARGGGLLSPSLAAAGLHWHAALPAMQAGPALVRSVRPAALPRS